MAKYGSARYKNSLYGSAVEHPYALVTDRVMWAVQVDWDRDGIFSGGIEPQAISRLKIKRGRARRMRADGLGQMHPGNESFEIEIIDPLARFDSFNTGSPVYNYIGAPGLLLRVVMVSTSTKAQAEPVFVGTLTGVQYDYASGIATLRGDGLSRYLEIGDAVSLYSPCQSFSAYAWDSYFLWDGTTPFPFNYWKGRPGGLTMRACASLVLARAGWPLGVSYGLAVYNNEQPDYFFMDGSNAWQTLKDLADGFAARLFFTRTGTLFVMDRLDPNGLDFSLAAPGRAQEASGLQRVSPFASLRNRAEVKVRPHSVMPFNNPISNSYYKAAWHNDGPVEVAPNSYIDINIKYPDGVDKPLQGSFVRCNGFSPVTNNPDEPYPMQIWSKADRTGTNMADLGLADFSMIPQHVGENSYGLTYVPDGDNQKFCTVRLRNWSTTLTAYYFDLQVQIVGVKETGQALTQVVEDAASIAINGRRVLEVNSRWIQNQAMATNIGKAYVDALSSRERASVASLTYQWSGQSLYANLLAYDLGSHVDFGARGGAASLANFGLYGRWLIVGQEITWLSADGQDALVKLTYEKAATISVTAGNVSSTSGANVSTLSWGHSVAAGSNRLLVVTVSKRAFSGAEVGTITFGGVALTKLGAVQQGSGNFPRVEIWYLVAPAAGSGMLVLTLAGSSDWIEAGGVDFANVSQTAPLGAPVYAWGSAGPASASVPASPGDLVIDALAYAGADATVGAGQTVKWAVSSDGNWKGACSTEPGATNVDMLWTVPAGGWAQMAAAVKGVG
jgi:hypothetical protein